jgi:DNA-binding NarL/FixJ family response regulator
VRVTSYSFLLAGFSRLLRDSIAESFRDDAELRMLDGDLPQLAELKPDLVVLDVERHEEDAAAMVAAVLREHPDVKLLVYGVEETREAVVPLIEAGARGYVTRNDPIPAFREALLLATRGEMAASDEIASALLGRFAQLAGLRRRTAKLEAMPLTARELAILRLVAEGLTNNAIARRLGVSNYTVKNHAQNIFRKLGVHRRIEAVEAARRAGWLDD